MSYQSARASARTIGLACLVVTSVGWGLNWPVMKYLLTQWPPLFARGVSGVIAALAIAAIAHGVGESLGVPRGQRWRLVACAFFNVFAWMGFSTLSLRWLGAGQGAMVVYTMPVWAMLFAWPIAGKRPQLAGVTGLVLAIAGLAVLFGGQAGELGAAQWPGVAFALLAAALFAFGTVAVRPADLPPFTQLAWQLLIGCAPMVAFGVAFERPDLRALSATGAGAMAYMTVFAMGICYLAWFAAVRRLAPTTASMGTLLTPVVGVVSGALVLGEALGARQWAALVLVLAGVVLALRER
ncbi:MAG: DMT family transporter [Burkholderiales bacterium]|nr:DMT family transporter [Burkholderiales bacterium]